MTKIVAGGTLPMSFQLMAFFIRNPDEELQTVDIIEKFGTPGASKSSVRLAMLPWVMAGHLKCTRTPSPRGGSFNTYTAGPKLPGVGA
jgi:hypothetical protein